MVGRLLRRGAAAPGRPVLDDPVADAQLRTEGWTFLDLIGPDAIARLRAVYEREHGWSGHGFEPDLTNPDVDYRRRVSAAIGAELDAPLRARFPGHVPFLRNFLCKWADADSALYLHQDWMYVDERARADTFVCWVALEDVDEGNGRLQVLPRSHRVDPSLRGTDLTADWVHTDTVVERLVGVDVAAGTCAVLNNALVHCSGPNTTASPRLVAAVGMRPADAPLTYFRRIDEARSARYDVDEDFFNRITPQALHAAPPDLPVAEVVDDVRQVLGPDELAARLDGRRQHQRWMTWSSRLGRANPP